MNMTNVIDLGAALLERSAYDNYSKLTNAELLKLYETDPGSFHYEAYEKLKAERAVGEAVEPPEPLRRFNLTPASKLTEVPAKPDWLIKRFLTRASIGMLFGAPEAGKSLHALDWAFCIASGIDCMGQSVQKGDVVVIAGEGHFGYKLRLKALELKYNIKSPDNLYITDKRVGLDNQADMFDIVESIFETCNPILIVVDTLHRNFDGEENSSRDIGAFITAIENNFKARDCAVLVVHHTGHGNNDRARGSSSIHGAMDWEYLIKKDEDISVLSCTKSKDYFKPKEHGFTIKPVPLGWVDEDGEEIFSVYLESIDMVFKTNPKAKHDEDIYKCLLDCMDKYGKGEWLYLDAWYEEAFEIVQDKKHFSRTFKRVKEKLLQNGIIRIDNNMVKLV